MCQCSSILCSERFCRAPAFLARCFTQRRSFTSYVLSVVQILPFKCPITHAWCTGVPIRDARGKVTKQLLGIIMQYGFLHRKLLNVGKNWIIVEITSAGNVLYELISDFDLSQDNSQLPQSRLS